MLEGCAVVFRVEDELTRTRQNVSKFLPRDATPYPRTNPNSDQHRTLTCQELCLYLIFKQSIPVVFEYAVNKT